MKTGIEAALAALSSDPAMAGSAGAGAAIVIWDDNLDHVLWASSEAAALVAQLAGPDGAGSALRERLRGLTEALAASEETRLERVRLGAAPSDAPTLLACRIIAFDGARALATVVVDPDPSAGAAAAGEDDADTPSPATSPEQGPAITALLDRIRRQGVRRFIWSLDRDGRFLSVSHPLAEVVGRRNADIVGRLWTDIVGRTVLDESGAVAGLLDRRSTWSDETVLWRITDTAYVVPVDLGGMPVFGRDHVLEGFRGFGLCRTQDAHEVPSAEPALAYVRERAEEPRPAVLPPEPLAEPERNPAYGALQARVGAQLGGGRPLAIRTASAGSGATDTSPETGEAKPLLSVAERGALREIARALGARLESDPVPEPPSGRASAEIVPLPAGRTREPDASRVLDRLPAGILVLKGEMPVYANRFVLDLLGFRDKADLAEKGGVARLFAGRVDNRVKRGSDPNPLVLIARTGGNVAVEVRLSTVEWGDGPASLLLVRPAPEPAAAPRSGGRELARKEAQLREAAALLDLVPLAIATLDEAGRILSLNRGAERLFGYAENELAGESYATLLAPESHREAADLMVRSREGEGEPDLVLAGRSRDRTPLPLSVTVRPLQGGDAAFALVARDLSEIRRGEAELRAAQRAADAATSRQAGFLARVSHEIRTPLNAVIGFAELMLEERFGPVGNERYRAYLHDIQASGGHVVSLVDDLLDLIRVQSGRTELFFAPVDVGSVVSESVGLMRGLAARERVVLRTSLSEGLPRVVADERSIRQILLNLLGFAVRLTAAGGQVIVSAAPTDEGGLSLRVRDTGTGLSPSDLLAALEPFRPVPAADARGGTGLGLPLAKALAEANRGTLTIVSERGSGTLAEVLFPSASRVRAE